MPLKQYVAFNYWTFQDETPDIDEKEVHTLRPKSLGEIVSTDDTLDVVNAIEARIQAYAGILMQRDYIARSYNEDGDVIDGEDNMISLCGFPGIFLSIDDTNNFLDLKCEPMSEEQYNKEYELALKDYSFSDDGTVVKTGPALTNGIIMDLVESVRKLCLNNEKKF